MTFFKNLEVYIPLLLAAPSTAAILIKNLCTPFVVENLYEAKRNGKPVGFTESIEEMILDELTAFVGSSPDKDFSKQQFVITKVPLTSKYRLFVVDDINTVVVGYPRFQLAEKAYVGLPYNISYDTVEDVAIDYDRLKISATTSPRLWWKRFFGGRRDAQKIEWGSEPGVKLMETLVLSNEEKRFLVQRTIQEADVVNAPFVETIGVVFPMLIAAIINYAIKTRFEMRKLSLRSPPILWPVYVCTTAMGLAGVHWLNGLIPYYIDTNADRWTARMGRSYADGGEAYYKKIMERNRCINQLLERAKMDKIYESDGDYFPHRWFTKPMTRLKDRLQVVKDTVNKANASEST